MVLMDSNGIYKSGITFSYNRAHGITSGYNR